MTEIERKNAKRAEMLELAKVGLHEAAEQGKPWALKFIREHGQRLDLTPKSMPTTKLKKPKPKKSKREPRREGR